MVILGLGSNIGDRLAYLRKALALIHRIPQLTVEQVSPLYVSDALLPPQASSSWDVPYLNLAIRCKTTLNAYELLHHTKQIEQQLGRHASIDWSPRIIDIDILAWDNFIKYDDKLHIPHEHLLDRPFALWPLTDVAPHWIYPIPGPLQGKSAVELAAKWGSKNDGNAPLHTRQIPHRIDTSALMGIVNLTPDSFSDGGNYCDPALAMSHIHQLVESGAELIDLGAEATGPLATPLDPKTEWLRLEPVLTALIRARSSMLIPPKISIDTRHSETACKALLAGADWINDVSGIADPKMREVMIDSHADIVFMHHLGIPANPAKTLPISENPVLPVYQWAEKKICSLGIDPSRLVFDVGIGYGKTAEQSMALIKAIDVFHRLGVRLLVGHSRKSFLKIFTQKPAEKRDLETTLISLYLSEKKVDVIRVHNVEDHARAFNLHSALN